MMKINSSELRDKIYGCWVGKSIGGTLGAPFEGNIEVQDVQGYTHKIGEPLPNDDLDLQLVWLKAIEEKGIQNISAPLLGEYWLSYISPHWNEYGISKSNLRAGLIPPISGEYKNDKWKHSNGAWIRTEIWACIAPGCPDIAIKYAIEDAYVDHGGGEGTYAAIFTAALQSAAFVINDKFELIKIGLSKIPSDCRVAKSVNIALDCYKNKLNWEDARTRVVEDSADLGWFQAPANVAFYIIGWLYGEDDFGESLKIAVNCGDDTDCTAATLGALLGIINGKEKIPSEWIDPIGEKIVTISIDRGSIAIPQDIQTLTDQVLRQTKLTLELLNADVKVVEEKSDFSQLNKSKLYDKTVSNFICNKSPFAVECDMVHSVAVLDYIQTPEISDDKPFNLKLTIQNKHPDCKHFDIIWHLPEEWIISPNASHIFVGHHPPTVEVMTQITPMFLCSSTVRGILEIIPHGRPTIGLIPLIFFRKQS